MARYPATKLNFAALLIIGCLLLISGRAVAAYHDYWLVSEQSSLAFLSTKNHSVTEIHHFTTVSGRILASGRAELAISLGSANTGIALRDQRLSEQLFDVGNYPLAMLSLELPKGYVDSLVIGQPQTLTTTALLALHNREKTLAVTLSTTKLSNNNLLVTTVEPVVINASDFALSDGLATLQKLAGLSSIASSVPVTAYLIFEIDTVSR